MIVESENYYDKSPSKEVVKESFDFAKEKVPFRRTLIIEVNRISEISDANIGQNQGNST